MFSLSHDLNSNLPRLYQSCLNLLYLSCSLFSPLLFFSLFYISPHSSPSFVSLFPLPSSPFPHTDARWADPAAFARPAIENRRNRLQGQGGLDEWGDLDFQGMGEEDRAAVMAAMREFQLQQGGGGDGARGGNLDPNLPMMQLFLQTFLPWNDVQRG
jgi:hypothetical protein